LTVDPSIFELPEEVHVCACACACACVCVCACVRMTANKTKALWHWPSCVVWLCLNFSFQRLWETEKHAQHSLYTKWGVVCVCACACECLCQGSCRPHLVECNVCYVTSGRVNSKMQCLVVRVKTADFKVLVVQCALCLGLARTVYVRRVWPYIWWFPSWNYRMYTVYIWFWPTLLCYKRESDFIVRGGEAGWEFGRVWCAQFNKREGAFDCVCGTSRLRFW
jgi:hypothetical protein